MRLVCVSDTHNKQRGVTLPEGDVLVHAGDFTMHGTYDEVSAVADWLAELPFRTKIVVAGNHDWLFERQPELARELMARAGVTYLEDESFELEGVRFWGSPWQPWMMSWAFNLQRGAPLREKWDLIPAGTDVLVTHGPPHGIGDRVQRLTGRLFAKVMGQGEHVGCEELREAVRRIRPRVHVFGHIHEGHGLHVEDGTTFVNPSCCDQRYRLTQPPLVVDVE